MTEAEREIPEHIQAEIDRYKKSVADWPRTMPLSEAVQYHRGLNVGDDFYQRIPAPFLPYKYDQLINRQELALVRVVAD